MEFKCQLSLVVGYPSVNERLLVIALAYLAEVLQGLLRFAVLSQHFQAMK